MNRYIKVYKNVLDPHTCESMIKLFDEQVNQHEEHNNQLMNFKQINLIQHQDVWQPYVSLLADKFRQAIDQYKVECKIDTPIQWPAEYGFEEFRLKRYEPNEGVFNLHTDVNNYLSARRFMVFFVYLNESTDPQDGGTEFPTLNSVCPRTQGSMLMFPPLWTYPHIGLMPKTSRKYIVGSYLHYLE